MSLVCHWEACAANIPRLERRHAELLRSTSIDILLSLFSKEAKERLRKASVVQSVLAKAKAAHRNKDWLSLTDPLETRIWLNRNI